jgi:hypothetical protein
MGIAVSPRTARRLRCSSVKDPRGVFSFVTPRRRAVLGETLWAEALLARFIVAPRFRILADMRARCSANQAKISLSSDVHGFLTGC